MSGTPEPGEVLNGETKRRLRDGDIVSHPYFGEHRYSRDPFCKIDEHWSFVSRPSDTPASAVKGEAVACPRCDRGEVFGMSTDDGFWVEMGAVAGGANEHGMNGWLELIEHHPDGREVRREYVAKDSPLYAQPQPRQQAGTGGLRIRCVGPWPACKHAEGACTASPDYQAAIAANRPSRPCSSWMAG